MNFLREFLVYPDNYTGKFKFKSKFKIIFSKNNNNLILYKFN